MTEDQFTRFVEYVEGSFQTLATKVDLKEMADSLRAEMRERFDIVHERLAALETGQEELRGGIEKLREQVNQQVNELGLRMDRLDATSRETNRSLLSTVLPRMPIAQTYHTA